MNQTSPLPQKLKTYRIETDRLLIRCYDPTDVWALQDAITESLDHLLPWMPWAKNEPEDLQTKTDRLRQFRGKFDLGLDYTFAIFDRTGHRFIGSTGFHTRIPGNALEIGYWIRKNEADKGYATEAAAALVKIGFWIEKLDRIEIHCDPENQNSRRVAERLGFKHEATLRNRFLDANNQLRDKMIWTMFREEYENTETKKMLLKAFDIVGKEIEQ